MTTAKISMGLQFCYCSCSSCSTFDNDTWNRLEIDLIQAMPKSYWIEGSFIEENGNTTSNSSTTELDEKREKRTLLSRCTKLVKKRLPIFSWLPQYKGGDFVADLIAGVTVGLTVVPQSMAYAAIAGLSPEYGLYSSYLGPLLYVVFGSCTQAAIGPTAVMGLLTFETCGENYPECAILTGFYSGIIELLMAVLQIGIVVSFISEPVTVGFTAGAATTILSSQIKNLFGISGPKGAKFIGYWTKIIQDITTIHLGDSIIGVGAFIALLLLKKLKDVKIKNPKLKTALWLTSLSRNVIIVLSTSVIAYVWSIYEKPPFKLTGQVKGGFPAISFPPFLLPVHTANSTTSNSTFYGEPEEYLDFVGSLTRVGSGPIVIALISVLQNVAISKAFGSGQSVDATQEMIALGASNVIGGFISAIPTSGSFSRSAVNEASGVRSPLGGFFTGVLVLLSLGFLTQSFYFIPKAGLAAVIISAVIPMIEYELLLPMWRISKIDSFVCLLTFLVAILVGMEIGILVGVGVNILWILMKFLRPSMKPELKSSSSGEFKYFLIRPETGLLFPSVDHARTVINKLALKNENIHAYVVNFEKWTTFDYTAATALVSLVKGFEKNNKVLVFLEPASDWYRALDVAGLSNPPTCQNSDLEEYLRKKLLEKKLLPPAGVVLSSCVFEKSKNGDNNGHGHGHGPNNLSSREIYNSRGSIQSESSCALSANPLILSAKK